MRMIAHCTFVHPCRMLMVTSSGDGALNKEQRLTKACVTLLVCFHFLLYVWNCAHLYLVIIIMMQIKLFVTMIIIYNAD